VSDAAELDMLEMSKHKSDKKTKSGTGTTTIVKPYDDDVKWYAVRMQAQGGGLQKSVAIRQATPVTVAQGLAALAALQAQLTARELRDRDVALALAAKWIQGCAPYGAGPPGKSDFNNPGIPGKEARVDVEILSGVNFTQ